MKDSKNIEDLFEQTKREKKEIDFDFEENSEFKDITRKLEEEKILHYDDFTQGEMKVINVKEDLKSFDYFSMEEEKKVEKKEEDVPKSSDTVKIISETNKEVKKVDKTGEPIIKFRDIKLSFDKEEVIKGISLDIYKGEFVYFVGHSGAGKSSLAKMIYREVKSSSGLLEVDKDNITKYKNSQMPKLRRKIGVIYQDFKLLNDKTVYENVKYCLDVTGYPSKDKKNQVLKTLKKVGIMKLKDKYPNELSGGQQQRVSIARAIVGEPLIIVADEPTGNLDPENAIIVMEILAKINDSGTTIIMATHDVGIVNKYKNRVVLIKDGLIENESEGEYIYE